MAKQFHWIDPRWIGIAVATGTSILLVLAAERHGVEFVVGFAGALLMGLHIALSPQIFRARPTRIAREEARDRFGLISTFSFLLLGAYLVIEFMVL